MTGHKITRVPTHRPRVLGKFTLTSTGLEVAGRPSWAEYVEIGEEIKRVHHASGFWLADWLRYGESRVDWQERLSQAHDATGLSEKRLKNIRSVGAISPGLRRDTVEFSHHEVVSSLPSADQEYFLNEAEMNGWTVRELRLNIRAFSRPKVLDAQAVLEGQYRVVYAGPPWSDMTIADLCKLPVAAHSAPNAVLFLWVPASKLFDNPGPREVIEAWGFRAKTGMVWDKVTGNLGDYFEVRHEHLIVATRGKCLPDVPTPQTDSVVTIRRGNPHAPRPEEFRQIIEKHWTTGPYLELFARKKVKGWSTFGSDSKQWAQEAKQ